MITRFATGDFTGQYKKTIGTDFMERDLEMGGQGKTIKLMLWDTAGQEMFSEITKNYYRGAGAVVYAFSTVDRDSFDAIPKWRARVQDECGDGLAEVIVQTKADLLSKSTTTQTEAEALAKQFNLKLYRVCTKENKMVEEVFQYLAEQFLDKSGAPPSKPKAAKKAMDPPGADPRTDAISPKDTFKLEPSRQRTGKKKSFCVVL
uniref:Ras-related protein Rab-23 n=1 Tax=Spongospora subterranea TaxID=70186 RepID=A0A0H5QST8_9EUKA|eukprot:CRZ04752.1 hypothetical protein [Spongospora subterranea]